MSVKQVSEELGVSADSLRAWLKKTGLNPKAENRGNKQKNEVIDVLKKSIGIIYSPCTIL